MSTKSSSQNFVIPGVTLVGLIATALYFKDRCGNLEESLNNLRRRVDTVESNVGNNHKIVMQHIQNITDQKYSEKPREITRATPVADDYTPQRTLGLLE